MGLTPETLRELQLSLVPGLGPVLRRRAVETVGSVEALLVAGEHALRRVKGIGDDRARTIAMGLREAPAAAEKELALADKLGVRVISAHDPEYPPLLSSIPDAPNILYIWGELRPESADRFPVAIVGSRECSTYGTEQAGRFALALAQSGLTIVSGGARGIDTAAHKATLQCRATGGRTIAVLGCGLANRYPPENTRLFAEIVESGAGAIVSELPLSTPPAAENFPARNRIISGMSLGVLVIEAAKRSGALITARLAVEEHNREVFALPGRLDSAASQGSLELIKSGGAALVTHPDDIIQSLESAARHLHAGTHAARFSAPTPEHLFNAEPEAAAPATLDAALSDQQRAILAALDGPKTVDEMLTTLESDAAQIRADLTMLEIKKRVLRRGSKFERAR